jgi:small GTP-binding protein
MHPTLIRESTTPFRSPLKYHQLFHFTFLDPFVTGQPIASMPKVKTVFAGDAGVGKTCIIERAAHDSFRSSSYATVGATSATVSVRTEIKGKDTTVIFNIWDTAGQEKYRSLAPMYFSGAHLAILVFDITQKQTFTVLHEFYDLMQQRAPPDCTYILVGNKSDLADQRQVTQDEAEEYRLQIGADFYFETSALKGSGVKEMFQKVAVAPGLTFETEEPDFIGIADEPQAHGTTQQKCC